MAEEENHPVISKNCVAKKCDIFIVDLKKHPEDEIILDKFLRMGLMKIKLTKSVKSNIYVVENIKNVNQLWTLIELFPNKPWNWEIIAKNPNTTYERIISRDDVKWNWDEISVNPNITMEIIRNNSQHPWNIPRLEIENINTTVELWKKRYKQTDTDEELNFSSNPIITLRDILIIFRYNKELLRNELHSWIRLNPSCTWEDYKWVMRNYPDLVWNQVASSNIDKIIWENNLPEDPNEIKKFFKKYHLRFSLEIFGKISMSLFVKIMNEEQDSRFWALGKFNILFKNPEIFTWEAIQENMEIIVKYIRLTGISPFIFIGNNLIINPEDLTYFYSMYNPNVDWDFIWTHYREIKSSQFYTSENFLIYPAAGNHPTLSSEKFFTHLSMNTFGRNIISEKEKLRRKQRRENLRETFEISRGIIPEMSEMVEEYEFGE